MTEPLVRFVETSRTFPDGFQGEELLVLNRINQKVAGGRSLGEVLTFVFTETQSIMPCDRIGVAFLEERGERVVSYWDKANYEPVRLPQGYGCDMGRSSLRQVVRTGMPRIIRDLEAYLAAKPDSMSARMLVQEGVRSNLTAPLVVDGKTVGFLFRSSRQVDAYRDHHVDIHAAMAEQLNQAVEKAHRIEQLERANRSYLEMLSFVSHELKNPIAAIITQARVLFDGTLGDMDPVHKELVGNIIQRGEFLLNLTREYLDLSRFEGGEGQLRNLKRSLSFVEEVLTPALDTITPLLKEQQSVLEIVGKDLDPHLDGDPTLLNVVMVNLLSNAAKYGNPGGRIRVTLKLDERRCLVSVWNEGPGFPESMKGKLFQKFSRLPKRELVTRKGSGVGLYVVWQILRLHRGSIRADSKDGSWAEFTLQLPLEQPEAVEQRSD